MKANTQGIRRSKRASGGHPTLVPSVSIKIIFIFGFEKLFLNEKFCNHIKNESEHGCPFQSVWMPFWMPGIACCKTMTKS